MRVSTSAADNSSIVVPPAASAGAMACAARHSGPSHTTRMPVGMSNGVAAKSGGGWRRNAAPCTFNACSAGTGSHSTATAALRPVE